MKQDIQRLLFEMTDDDVRINLRNIIYYAYVSYIDVCILEVIIFWLVFTVYNKCLSLSLFKLASNYFQLKPFSYNIENI